MQQSLQNGTNVNCILTFLCLTPLTVACHQGHDQIGRILLDADANVWWKSIDDEDDDTLAISIACKNGYLSIVKMLINHDNGLLEFFDNWRRTPLHFAIDGQHYDILRFLLKRGANVHHVTCTLDRPTSLMYACGGDTNTAILRLLLSFGVDLEVRDRRQHTALHHAEKLKYCKL